MPKEGGERAQRGEQNALPQPVSAAQCKHNAQRFRRLTLLGLAALVSLLTWHSFEPLRTYDWLPASVQSGSKKAAKVNIILMISDGYGPASETFGRSFHQALHNNTAPEAHYKTPLDQILIGSHRSRSTDSLITDSAAGATAFSCALKSYNGAIGVDANGALCATVLEGAKEKGLLTGVVVTSRLSDATPAAFFAHVASRAQESDIANEALGLTPNGTSYRAAPLDLAIGGGGCYFLPRSSPFSCRLDEQDLVSVSREMGWNTRILFDNADVNIGGGIKLPNVQSLAHAESYRPTAAATINMEQMDTFLSEGQDDSLPLLALLAPFNTPYEIDRPKAMPSLRSLALKALNALDRSASNTKGFFVMIEGSQIDLCAHSNDPACHAREIGAYQDTIADVTRWVNEKNQRAARFGEEKTILLSTSDHETGGLTLGRQLTSTYPNYAYYPSRLIPVQQSAASLSAGLIAFAHPQHTTPPSKEVIEQFVRSRTLGQHGAAFLANNGGEPTAAEVGAVMHCIAHTPSPPSINTRSPQPPIDTADVCRAVIADLISRRAEVGWSTSGHTGVDVPVHGIGPSLKYVTGNIENTEIGTFIAQQIGIDLDRLTRRLKKQRPSKRH